MDQLLSRAYFKCEQVHSNMPTHKHTHAHTQRSCDIVVERVWSEMKNGGKALVHGLLCILTLEIKGVQYVSMCVSVCVCTHAQVRDQTVFSHSSEFDATHAFISSMRKDVKALN